MDSLTQIALGAAVGTAVLGREVGARAAFWGAVCGTLPDLDVLVPYGDPVRDFTFHRAESHALFWLTVASPGIAWVIARLNRKSGASFREWWLLAWLALVTHTLLDAFTIRRQKGKLAGLTVAIAGDVTHSRVARSNAHLLTRMGATVRVCAPRTMMPAGIERLGVEVHDKLTDAVKDADVVMMLRIQSERLGEVLFPSTREYSRQFGLSRRVLALAKPDAIVMHPGPMNRGVEIDPDVADGERSVILDQVEAGVAVRMAVLYLLAAEAGQSPLS